MTVEQKDRTGEFRQLHAKRQTLKKYLDALVKLRDTKNPSVDDALKIEQKVQEAERDLQALSVQLGEFLGKESFYHVQVTLHEFQPGSRFDRTYTVPQRLLNGMFWAAPWWLATAAACGVLAGVALSVRALRPGPVFRPATPAA
jgi:hypothetical protein